MKSVDIYYWDKLVGQLREVSSNHYEFTYSVDYLSRKDCFPISIEFPLGSDTFIDSKMFNTFENMLPESSNREDLCKKLCIKPNDSMTLFDYMKDHNLMGFKAMRVKIT